MKCQCHLWEVGVTCWENCNNLVDISILHTFVISVMHRHSQCNVFHRWQKAYCVRKTLGSLFALHWAAQNGNRNLLLASFPSLLYIFKYMTEQSCSGSSHWFLSFIQDKSVSLSIVMNIFHTKYCIYAFFSGSLVITVKLEALYTFLW